MNRLRAVASKNGGFKEARGDVVFTFKAERGTEFLVCTTRPLPKEQAAAVAELLSKSIHVPSTADSFREKMHVLAGEIRLEDHERKDDILRSIAADRVRYVISVGMDGLDSVVLMGALPPEEMVEVNDRTARLVEELAGKINRYLGFSRSRRNGSAH